MCWLCDHPNATRADYADVLRAKMLKNGWALQYVESQPTPWAYTIGLHDWGRPELLVTGVSPPRAVRLLNAVTRDALRGLTLEPGRQIQVADGPLVEVVEVDHPDVHMGWAVAIAGSPIRALQLVWADGRGRWPWSPQFCDGRRRQPVFGLRTQNA
jgi:hypothetical protein